MRIPFTDIDVYYDANWLSRLRKRFAGCGNPPSLFPLSMLNDYDQHSTAESLPTSMFGYVFVFVSVFYHATYKGVDSVERVLSQESCQDRFELIEICLHPGNFEYETVIPRALDWISMFEPEDLHSSIAREFGLTENMLPFVVVTDDCLNVCWTGNPYRGRENLQNCIKALRELHWDNAIEGTSNTTSRE